jgi:DNA-binding NtrC family response regulator
MRLALLCSVLLTLLASAAFACGDKFLVAGHNPRYAQVRAPVHPASVLVFRNKMAGVRKALSDPEIKSTLEGMGHKVKVVDDAASLEKTLKSKKYDIVIADMADTGPAQSAIQTTSSKATLLPVMYNPSVSEFAVAKTEYKTLLQMPSEPNQIISVIQDTMALR